MTGTNELKRLSLLFGVLLIQAILLTGCGKDYSRGEAEGENRLSLPNVDITVRRSKEDLAFAKDGFPSSMRENDAEIFAKEYFKNTAAAKRKAALKLGRELFYYKLLNYAPDPAMGSSLSPNFLLAIRLDGVSGLLYNTAYLFSLPCKVLKSFQISSDFWNWLADICSLLLGSGVALLMIPGGLIIGTICHPIETLANLTCGIFYWPPETVPLFSAEYLSVWRDYVCNTNLLVSAWDLLWGAIVYPLWQAVGLVVLMILAVIVGIILLGASSQSGKKA